LDLSNQSSFSRLKDLPLKEERYRLVVASEKVIRSANETDGTENWAFKDGAAPSDLVAPLLYGLVFPSKASGDPEVNERSASDERAISESIYVSMNLD
jgi:hypothetical protein